MVLRNGTASKDQPSVATAPHAYRTSPHASLSRQFLLKTIGIVGIVGLLAIAAAANQGLENQKNNAAKNSAAAFKASLGTSKTQATNNQSQPASGAQPIDDSSTTSEGSAATGNASNTSSSSVNVTVNGQPVPVKQNGTTQKTITTPDGSTNISVNNNQSADGSGRSSSFTSTHVNSNSTGSGSSSIQVESHDGT
jgi:hypothetical protein